MINRCELRYTFRHILETRPGCGTKMGFSRSIREEALVRAARRCCVCRRFKGVGVEVHHILPLADGGENSLDNAIVLCFDCHCAAGHYNPKHPKGTKFSPGELHKHRDGWFQRVSDSGVDAPEPEEFSRYYSRHLLCMDAGAAGDLLDMDRERIPFRYDYVLSNRVLDFMRNVLADELPHASDSSLHSPGQYWGDGEFQSLQDFHEMHPEFGGETSRPLNTADFCDDGLVPSRVMRQAVEAGLPPSEIGNACVEEYGCADGPNYFASVRRPLFLFAELRNDSEEPVVFSSLIARSDEESAFVRKLSTCGTGHLLTVDHSNLTLNPGDILLVPECVVLSGQSYDPMHTEFEVEYEMSEEQVQSVGLCGAGDSSDFYVIGPASIIEGYKLIVDHNEVTATIHPFELDKCYLYFRAWMVGSCPHLYVFDQERGWSYIREILSDSSPNRATCERLFMSENIQRLRIVETDYESTVIENLKFNDESLIHEPAILQRGDEMEFSIDGPGTLVISGWYDASIMVPENPLQARQQQSLRAAYEFRRGIGNP